jgi:hypothetical protein
MALNERLGSDKPAISGPEKYAPPNRRAPEKLSDADQAAADVVEGEIHDIVRRIREDVATVPTAVTAAENVNELIRRVSGASTEEIDHVIFELQVVRDMLRSEGERVSREIAGYASLSHAATTAMKVITDSLRQWKSAPHTSGPRS